MPWFPVAAPEDPTRRINQGDNPLTAEELREVATSYDPKWRRASLICGYDLETRAHGTAHGDARFRPEVGPILDYRFNETAGDLGELEALIDVNDRLTRLFAKGFRTPSIATVRFPDHPDGVPRRYGQHVALTGPGEVEIIAGLGGERWEERFRAFRDGIESPFADSIREQKFRSLTDQEIQMKETEAPAPASEATEQKQIELPGTEKVRAATDSPKAEAKPPEATPEAPKKEEPKQRAATPDPQAETSRQLAEMRETVAGLAETVRAFAETAGDPAKIRAATAEVEKLVGDTRTRAEADQKVHITREVEALASGSEPRLRSAEVEFTTRALLAMGTTEAETELKRFRAQDPVATDLDKEFKGETFEGLPVAFDLERYRANDGQLPGAGQVRQLAVLAAEGDGDPLAAAYAREKAQKMRRAYHG